MNLFEKLGAITFELKAPKNQYNSFGKYKYRSCEDILEAVKPLLNKYKCSLTIEDEIVLIGERYYVKSIAHLYDNESIDRIMNVAYAREADEKKGMDEAQISGTSSSYSRKYCLNGLFLIDDTKDADTDEHALETNSKQSQAKPQAEKKRGAGPVPPAGSAQISPETIAKLKAGYEKSSTEKQKATMEVLKNFGYKTFSDIEASRYNAFTEALKAAFADLNAINNIKVDL